MIFHKSSLPGCFVIELEKKADDRGYFARTYSQDEFRGHGLTAPPIQMNMSFTAEAHTLRGMHYQLPPAAETKLVRCSRGAIFDVALDLRPSSPTFGRSFGVELSPENGRMLFVPEGFAHGFLSLKSDTEVTYVVSAAHSPENERGIRFSDPYFNIEWPALPNKISEKDRNWRLFDESFHRTSLFGFDDAEG